MDWTCADKSVTVAARPNARRVCAAGRTGGFLGAWAACGTNGPSPLLHAFAKRLAYAAQAIGEAGIVAAVSPEEMWSLGLEMDCGKSFERMYRQQLGDLRSLELDGDRIDDPLILGSAIFSEWRYYTHWANSGMDEDAVRWFEVAARRLGGITDE